MATQWQPRSRACGALARESAQPFLSSSRFVALPLISLLLPPWAHSSVYWELAGMAALFSRVATLLTRGRRLLSKAASVDRVRKLAGVKSCALVAIVEGIHNRHGYDQYASTNSQLLAPHTADLMLASRKYADELRFQELFCSAEPPERGTWEPVDRVPIVFSRGDAVLQWISGDAYLGGDGNVHVRQSASGHANVYLVWSANDDLYDGRPISDLGDVLATAPVTLAVLETFEGASTSECEAVVATLERCGARSLLSRRGAASGSDEWAVIEGSAAEGLDLFSFHSWSALERCAKNAEVREAVSAFEAAGGKARALAFEVDNRRWSRGEWGKDSADMAFFHGPIAYLVYASLIAYGLWSAKQKGEW